LTKLYWTSHRFYNPEWGRFLIEDTYESINLDIIGGLNLFAYSKNNPIMFSDPNGEFAITSMVSAILIGTSIGLVGGCVGSIVSQWITCEGVIDFKQVVVDTIIGGITGAIGGITANVLVQMISSGALEVIGGLISGDVTSFSDAAKSFLLAAFTAGISYAVSTAISDCISLRKFKQLRSGSSLNCKVNQSIKQLAVKCDAFVGLTIGKNTVNDFVKAFGKTTSNLIISNTVSNITTVLLIPLEFIKEQ